MKALVLVLVLVTLTGCITVVPPAEEPPAQGIEAIVFSGGTNALLINFERDAPPDLVYANNHTPFEIIVRVENDGEFDTTNVNWRITGVNTHDFANLPLTGSFEDLMVGRTRLEDGIIPGEVSYQWISPSGELPICYQRSLSDGDGLEMTLGVNVCYAYATLASSTVCIRENYLEGDGCDQSSQVSVSGAPVTITGFNQQIVGANRLRLQYDIEARTTANVWAPGPTQTCIGSREDRLKQENQVYVKMDVNGLGHVSCNGLADAIDEFDGEYVFDSENYPQDTLTGALLNFEGVQNDASGYIRLDSNGRASLVCTFTVNETAVDSVGSVDLALSYFIEDRITKPITIVSSAGEYKACE